MLRICDLFLTSKSHLYIKPSFNKLYHNSCYYFARRVSQPMAYKERKIFQQESKPAETIDEHKVDEREDPASKNIDDLWMSKSRLDVQHLPERLLKRCQQVFSKFEASEIREMGKKYMKLYQLLHASEKPQDLSKLQKPFANTEDLVNNPGDEKAIIYLGKKRYDETEGQEPPKKEKKPKNTKSNLEKNLKEGTEDGEEDLKGKPQEKKINSDFGIVYEKNTVLAYLLRKMPHTFGVSCRVFSEIKYRLPDFKPKTFLDYGAGLGSGSWAFNDLFTESERIVGVEPSTGMRKLGKHLTQDISKMIWLDSLASIVSINDIEGGFDFVYCGYVLEEAKSPQSREMIIETLWQKVNPGGVLVVIEPGSPKGYRFIHDFREWIRAKPRTEANIIAPCPHHRECPLAKLPHMWCNFEQPIAKYPKSVFPKLPKERTIDLERFSFLAIKKGLTITNKELATTPAEKSYFWDRIMKPILKRERHYIMDVCSINGELEKIIIAKSHGEESGYKHIKKLKWGDLWPFGRRIPNKYRKEGKRGKRLW